MGLFENLKVLKFCHDFPAWYLPLIKVYVYQRAGLYLWSRLVIFNAFFYLGKDNLSLNYPLFPICIEWGFSNVPVPLHVAFRSDIWRGCNSEFVTLTCISADIKIHPLIEHMHSVCSLMFKPQILIFIVGYWRYLSAW